MNNDRCPMCKEHFITIMVGSIEKYADVMIQKDTI